MEDVSSESLSIPAALLAEINAAADEEHRPAGDVLRDLVEQGLIERRQWKAEAERETQRARELGIDDAAAELPISDEYRQNIREKIAQGVTSLREGRFTDGESFMATVDAELAGLERQGNA